MQKCEMVCIRNEGGVCIFTEKKGYEDYRDKCFHRNFINREREYKQSKKPKQFGDKQQGFGGLALGC